MRATPTHAHTHTQGSTHKCIVISDKDETCQADRDSNSDRDADSDESLSAEIEKFMGSAFFVKSGSTHCAAAALPLRCNGAAVPGKEIVHIINKSGKCCQHNAGQ